MSNNPRVNREFRALIPPLTPEEYSQLEQNILAHGCRDPIVLWRNIIVDGHNRFVICTRHGISYETVKQRFATCEDAKVWILENQLGRRNLTDAMRIELATRKVHYMGLTSFVRKNIAHEAKLSERTVQRYMHIKTEGDADLLDKVMTGQLKIGTAHKQMAGAAKPKQIAVTTTTREPLCPGYVYEEPDYAKTAVYNLGCVENFCAFLSRNRRYCAGVDDGLKAWLDAYIRRVVRLARRVARCAKK